MYQYKVGDRAFYTERAKDFYEHATRQPSWIKVGDEVVIEAINADKTLHVKVVSAPRQGVVWAVCPAHLLDRMKHS